MSDDNWGEEINNGPNTMRLHNGPTKSPWELVKLGWKRLKEQREKD